MSRKKDKNFNFELNFSQVFPYLLRFTGAKTQEEFASMMGFSTANVTNVKRRNKIPAEWLIQLAIQKNLSIDELIKEIFKFPQIVADTEKRTHVERREGSEMETGLIKPFECPYPKRRVEDRYYVLLPILNKGKIEIQEYQFMRIYALKSWLEPQLNASSDQAFITIMEGDSMTPTINSGDILICDGEHGSIKDVPIEDVIYILQLEGRGPIVRRIQGLPGKFFRIIADNPKFEPFTIPADSNCHIIGRVIWVIKKF